MYVMGVPDALIDENKRGISVEGRRVLGKVHLRDDIGALVRNEDVLSGVNVFDIFIFVFIIGVGGQVTDYGHHGRDLFGIDLNLYDETNILF